MAKLSIVSSTIKCLYLYYKITECTHCAILYSPLPTTRSNKIWWFRSSTKTAIILILKKQCKVYNTSWFNDKILRKTLFVQFCLHFPSSIYYKLYGLYYNIQNKQNFVTLIFDHKKCNKIKIIIIIYMYI